MANKNMNIIGAGEDTARRAPKKYKTIVADPPWNVKAGRDLGGYVVVNGKQVFDQTHQKSRDLAYPSMSIAEISALPVSEWAEEYAHLYIWTINKYVEQVYQVARAWGFTPSTMLVWAKNPLGGGLGGTYRITTEYCLFCRRGTLAAKSRITGTWWNWKRPYVNGYPCHSKKPEQFQDMIETVSPGPYLELFARRVRPGWDAWGNEIKESPVLGEDPAQDIKEICHTATNTPCMQLPQQVEMGF
jgi:N6-adenosine-specific RNA methylase IME4